jgi:chromosome segregation ATPase
MAVIDERLEDVMAVLGERLDDVGRALANLRNAEEELEEARSDVRTAEVKVANLRSEFKKRRDALHEEFPEMLPDPQDGECEAREVG